MKRFYKLVSKSGHGKNYNILLDGKAVKTPDKNVLSTEHAKLADAVVLEWAEQKENIDPASMPMTQMLTTQIDRLEPQKDEIRRQVLNYINTDLVCYMTDDPPDLVKAQNKKWTPVLDYIEEQYGVRPATTTALNALSQDNVLHSAAKGYVEKVSDEELLALHILTNHSGSIFLALMYLDGKISLKDMMDAALVNENFYAGLYRADLYGADPMQEKRDAQFLKDGKDIEAYLKLSGRD